MAPTHRGPLLSQKPRPRQLMLRFVAAWTLVCVVAALLVMAQGMVAHDPGCLILCGLGIYVALSEVVKLGVLWLTVIVVTIVIEYLRHGRNS